MDDGKKLPKESGWAQKELPLKARLVVAEFKNFSECLNNSDRILNCQQVGLLQQSLSLADVIVWEGLPGQSQLGKSLMSLLSSIDESVTSTRDPEKCEKLLDVAKRATRFLGAVTNAGYTVEGFQPEFKPTRKR